MISFYDFTDLEMNDGGRLCFLISVFCVKIFQMNDLTD